MKRQTTVFALGALLALASAAPSFAQGNGKTTRHAVQHNTQTNPYAGYFDYDTSNGYDSQYNSGSMGGVGR
jgi:hypothetical protein